MAVVGEITHHQKQFGSHDGGERHIDAQAGGLVRVHAGARGQPGSHQKTDEVKRDADLCLRPPIDEFGVLEFQAIDRIVEVGYRYAREKLEQIRSDKALAGIFLAAV